MRRPGRHRRVSRRARTHGLGQALALGCAVAGALTLLALPTPTPAPAQVGGPLTLTRAWPSAAVVDSPAWLPDGTLFSPLYHLDAAVAVGTAPAQDNSAVRLLLRDGDGALRELHRLPDRSTPQFGGFTAAGDDLVWAESTATPDGAGETRLWRANWRSAGAPLSLTADTGDAVFFNSQYDLVVADGAVHWVAASRTVELGTEVRSVALAGGAVAIQPVEGAFAMSAWPWLVSAGTGQNGPVQLRDVGSGATVTVPAQPTELVTCAPSWCRVLVLGGDGGPARMDLMHPDGSDRRRMAGGQVSASVTDVGVLDRFEVLSQNGLDGSPTSSQELLLYDIAERRTVTVATAVGMVLCRGGVLWWSTGDNEALVWHALDLRTLP